MARAVMVAKDEEIADTSRGGKHWGSGAMAAGPAHIRSPNRVRYWEHTIRRHATIVCIARATARQRHPPPFQVTGPLQFLA
jgi:hypothetical protein